MSIAEPGPQASGHRLKDERDRADILAQARAQLTFVCLKQVDDAIKVAVPDSSPGTYPPKDNLEFDPP